MSIAHGRVADFVGEIGAAEREITVSLSNELVHLLSEQMYQSPLKAIEELVVNAYDAGAQRCLVFVPLPPAADPLAVVYDDGMGMDPDGLTDLWHIGRSKKRDPETERRLARKQIGKFGIGKLATYAIADQVTYITKTGVGILAVTMDFRLFKANPTGGEPIPLTIRTLTDRSLAADPRFVEVLKRVNVDSAQLTASPSWTFVVLEDLKPKMGGIRRRDLNWVLSTAMPLQDTFKLYLNGEEMVSRIAGFDHLVEFDLAKLPKARLAALEERTSDGWKVSKGALISTTFPSGIKGKVTVTKQSLYASKSTDLARSHGFFVKVRGRLVDESDPLFGIEPLSYDVFNRFRADLEADDLDAVVTAPREGFEASDLIEDFRLVLRELFYEAQSQYRALLKAEADKEKRKSEDTRQFVNPSLVELPIADALSATHESGREGSEADETWFYLRVEAGANRDELLNRLYDRRREAYTYSDVEAGRSGRLVQFEPNTGSFLINVEHPLVQAHDDPHSRSLLEDVATAEVMLEVYLREYGVPRSAVGEVLERRDQLLRSLAADHVYSMAAIAAQLRDSIDDKYDLEVNLVIAARALGFVAKHIGGADRPDGAAKYSEYPGGEQKITLEAKSTNDVPSLAGIDFAGLQQHVSDESGAVGCLLIAPGYPGSSRGEDAQAAKRAEAARVSCWTVEQLASVLDVAEARHISAADILSIVLNAFAPDQVKAAVDRLLSEPTWVRQELYAAVVDALKHLEGRLKDQPRTVDQVATEITADPRYRDVPGPEIRAAVEAVVGASQGLLILTKNRLTIRGDYSELERRLASLLGREAPSRRPGTFRQS